MWSLCRFDFLLSWRLWLVMKVSPWATRQRGNAQSFSTKGWQCPIPSRQAPRQLWASSAVPEAPGMKRSKILEKGNCLFFLPLLTNKNTKEEFWKKTFSPARIQASSPQLVLFTSSNSNSKCFEVLLHFFLWKQKSQQLKQNWEWENPKIEIITNQRRGLYMGWWSHWPALPSNFSPCQLWWVLYF